MPQRAFDVESYTVLTTQSGNTANGAWRHLGLTSPDLSHGIRVRASIYFFSTISNTVGLVTNVDQPNFDGIQVYAYCRKPDFAEWYDILRNERPLRCSFGYDGPEYDPNKPARKLWWIELFTGTEEPPGEGPEEIQARTFPASILELLQGEQMADPEES